MNSTMQVAFEEAGYIPVDEMDPETLAILEEDEIEILDGIPVVESVESTEDNRLPLNQKTGIEIENVAVTYTTVTDDGSLNNNFEDQRIAIQEENEDHAALLGCALQEDISAGDIAPKTDDELDTNEIVKQLMEELDIKDAESKRQMEVALKMRLGLMRGLLKQGISKADALAATQHAMPDIQQEVATASRRATPDWQRPATQEELKSRLQAAMGCLRSFESNAQSWAEIFKFDYISFSETIAETLVHTYNMTVDAIDDDNAMYDIRGTARNWQYRFLQNHSKAMSLKQRLNNPWGDKDNLRAQRDKCIRAVALGAAYLVALKEAWIQVGGDSTDEALFNDWMSIVEQQEERRMEWVKRNYQQTGPSETEMAHTAEDLIAERLGITI